jgi:cell division protease FtsH
MKRITDEAYTKAKELIETHRDELSNVAAALLKYETLDADEVTLILEGNILDKPTVTDLLAAEQAKSEVPKPEPEAEVQQEPQEQPAD